MHQVDTSEPAHVHANNMGLIAIEYPEDKIDDVVDAFLSRIAEVGECADDHGDNPFVYEVSERQWLDAIDHACASVE